MRDTTTHFHTVSKVACLDVTSIQQRLHLAALFTLAAAWHHWCWHLMNKEVGHVIEKKTSLDLFMTDILEEDMYIVQIMNSCSRNLK